ncbi:unnamed protein product [Notodromas monacha]|uniref:DUF1736 domain-containing protein n=1 Tax=Notodromas monacha TaxID=399045 RepID=A0A7R9GDS5_9CRUS|nr:unnamed protein product [Notodromas monacha]CAG0918849.1 unnamed protein product [Notodromas monacha]
MEPFFRLAEEISNFACLKVAEKLRRYGEKGGGNVAGLNCVRVPYFKLGCWDLGGQADDCRGAKYGLMELMGANVYASNFLPPLSWSVRGGGRDPTNFVFDVEETPSVACNALFAVEEISGRNRYCYELPVGSKYRMWVWMGEVGSTYGRESVASVMKTATEYGYLLCTVGLVAAAMLSKEQGITVIGICAVYEFLVVQKISLREVLGAGNGVLNGKFSIPARFGSAMARTATLVAGAFVLLLCRVMIMGSQLPVFTRFDNPAAAAGSPARQLTYQYLLGLNFWLLLFPCDLCCDWTMGTVPLVESLADWRNLVTLVFYAGLLRAIWWIMSLESGQRRDVIAMFVEIKDYEHDRVTDEGIASIYALFSASF